jgi:signal transduction histidine kinase
MHTKAINILMVDDDACDCKLIKQVLKRSSQAEEFVIETAENLADGLTCIKKHSFDLVLLDLNLPDSRGIETVKETHVANPNVPIVVLTGLDDEQTGLEAIRNGAEDYLVKGESLQFTVVRAIRYAIERKQTRKLKEEAEAKSRFVSAISHELRTPLTAMKEGIAIILNGEAGKIKDKQRKFLDIIRRNIDRLTRLIDDVLDFQKIEAGKTKFDMQENDINEVVKEIQKAMEPLVNEKGLTIVAVLDESVPIVNFDRDKITQVLTNLVNNAVKFTTQGRITITTARRNSSVCVSVQDTGGGIKREDLPRLFCEFEQLSDNNERVTGGTGLGLVISRKIIEEHTGKIWAESELGKGTSFNFVLPIREQQKQLQQKNASG